jgi:hypothetical protein
VFTVDIKSTLRYDRRRHRNGALLPPRRRFTCTLNTKNISVLYRSMHRGYVRSTPAPPPSPPSPPTLACCDSVVPRVVPGPPHGRVTTAPSLVWTCGASASAAASAAAAMTSRQGLALVHLSAQRKRFLWNGGAFRGCLRVVWEMSGGIKEYQGVFRVYFVAETARAELRSGRV